MSEPLRLIAPDPVKHRDEMLDLIAKVFSHSGYYDFHGRLREGYYGNSHYDHAASRIGILDDKIVTHYGVWDYQMRIGTARVRTGGIGVVATHGEYRKRGLMDMTARASIEAMRMLGYDFTILFGIWNYYHKFGYTRAWADTNINAEIKLFPEMPKGLKTKSAPAKPDDELAALYNRYHATSTGTAVRPTYRATFYPVDKNWTCTRWLGKNGKTAGYVLMKLENSRPVVMELVGDIATGLAVIRAEAENRDAWEVRFEKLPPESELGRWLRRGTCRVETQYIASGGAMIQLLNLRQALEKMAGELERRLAGSDAKKFSGTLAVGFHKETVGLAIKNGRVKVVPGPVKSAHAVHAGAALAQLLIGTDDPALVCAQQNIKLTGAAAELLPILFPQQPILLYQADRY